jgi:hypothetical protein
MTNKQMQLQLKILLLMPIDNGNGNSSFDEAAKSINVENSQTHDTRSVTSKNFVQSERNGNDLIF